MDNAKKPPKDDVLENTVSDLKALKGSEKKDGLKAFVSATIKQNLKEHKSEMQNLLEEKNQSLIEMIETQKYEIEC